MMDGTSGTSDRTRAAMHACYAALRTLDADAFARTFEPDGVVTEGPSTPSLRGREAIRELIASLALDFRSMTREPEEVYVTDGSAAVAWRGEVTTVAGRTAPLSGIDLFEVSDAGRIVSLQWYWDADLLRRLAEA